MVAVTVDDAEPVAGAHVTLYDAVGQLLAEVFTREDGKATIPTVPLGSYVVGVRKIDYALVVPKLKSHDAKLKCRLP